MTLGFTVRLMLLMLASFLGAEVTRRVSAGRREAVGKLTTGLSGVVVVGAIIAAGRAETRFAAALGILAVTLAVAHVAGAFLLGRAAMGEPDKTEPTA